MVRQKICMQKALVQSLLLKGSEVEGDVKNLSLRIWRATASLSG